MKLGIAIMNQLASFSVCPTLGSVSLSFNLSLNSPYPIFFLFLEVNHLASSKPDPVPRYLLAASMFNGCVMELIGQGFSIGNFTIIDGERIMTVRNIYMLFQKFESR